MQFSIPDSILKRSILNKLDPDRVVERQRFVVYRIFTLTALILCLGVFVKMVISLPNSNYLPFFVLFIGLVISINYLRIKKPSELPVAYLVILVSALVVLHCTAYTFGGIRTSAIFFMWVLIIYSFILLGYKGGWLIAGLAAAHIIFMFIIYSNLKVVSFSLFNEWIDLNNEGFPTNILFSFLLVSALSSYLHSNGNVVFMKIVQSKLELERINLELIERNESLEKKNAELAKFTSVAAHDLRSPIRAIGSLTDMILNDEAQLSVDSNEKLSIIRKRAIRMNQLLSALSDFSQVDEIINTIELVEVKFLVEEVIEKYLEKSNVSFSVSDGMPEIYTSAAALKRVFDELICNAIKFNDKKRIRVEIASHKFNDFWHFSVKDNGPGIGSSFKDKVFVIFQTLGARNNFKRTGVGLAIARKLVLDSQGEIWFSSDQADGVTFHFTWTEKQKSLIDQKSFSEESIYQLS